MNRNSREDENVYGLIDFGPSVSDEPKWTQLGKVKYQDNGVAELIFDCWPSNAIAIHIVPAETVERYVKKEPTT